MSDLRNRPASTQPSSECNHDTTNINQNIMHDEKTNHQLIELGMDTGNTELGGSRKDNSNDKFEINGGPHYKEDFQIMGRNFNIIVFVTHFNIFLYSGSFWIQNAVFPYLSKELGADPVTFGYLQTVFALVQLAGGPLFGRFGDLFGSRMAMMLAFTAAALSYFFLFMSTSIPMLFLSRLPSVFMHAMQGGQMIVTDVCDSKDRASALSRLGISYGIGMVIGPLVGGLISKYLGLRAGSLVACCLSLLSVLLVYIHVPSRLKRTSAAEEKQKKTKLDTSKESVFSLKKIRELLKAPGASFLLGIKLGTGIPMGIFQSMFSIVALEVFKLPPEQNSYMMSYIGIMAMTVQGFVVGPVSKRFSELKILLVSAGILCFSYLLMSFVTSIAEMCVVFIPLVTGLTLQNVLTTSALTHTVSETDTGAMLGMNMAINSLIRAMSPTIGGYMLSSYGFNSFGFLGFFTSIIVIAVLVVKIRS